MRMCVHCIVNVKIHLTEFSVRVRSLVVKFGRRILNKFQYRENFNFHRYNFSAIYFEARKFLALNFQCKEFE